MQNKSQFYAKSFANLYIYEMPAEASYFPAYLIAFADPKQVDFETEVG